MRAALFDSAGPHFNPGNTHHGIVVGPGHAGDKLNLHIPPSGSLEVELVDTAITIDSVKPNLVFHPDGTAVVVKTTTARIRPETPATGLPVA